MKPLCITQPKLKSFPLAAARPLAQPLLLWNLGKFIAGCCSWTSYPNPQKRRKIPCVLFRSAYFFSQIEDARSSLLVPFWRCCSRKPRTILNPFCCVMKFHFVVNLMRILSGKIVSLPCCCTCPLRGMPLKIQTLSCISCERVTKKLFSIRSLLLFSVAIFILLSTLFVCLWFLSRFPDVFIP